MISWSWTMAGSLTGYAVYRPPQFQPFPMSLANSWLTHLPVEWGVCRAKETCSTRAVVSLLDQTLGTRTLGFCNQTDLACFQGVTGPLLRTVPKDDITEDAHVLSWNTAEAVGYVPGQRSDMPAGVSTCTCIVGVPDGGTGAAHSLWPCQRQGLACLLACEFVHSWLILIKADNLFKWVTCL